MKTMTWIFGCTLALTALPAIAALRGGAGDGGGGHGFSSTPQEVRDYLQKPATAWGGTQAEVDIRYVQDRLNTWMALSPDYAPNATVKKVLLAMHEAYPGKKFGSAAANKLLAVSEACYDHDGSMSDGATTIGKLDAPICMNVNSLARYPAEDLRTEIVALYYHEWTHQLGFGETEAVEMQNYVKHYVPMVLSTTGGPQTSTTGGPTYSLPMRDGGVRTVPVAGQRPLAILCVSLEKWWSWVDQGPDSPGHRYSMTIFPGQSVLLEGEQADVLCSDLPQVDCRVEPSNGPDCEGSLVYFGKGKDNSVCLNKFNSSGYRTL
jgi:hypothetical protein